MAEPGSFQLQMDDGTNIVVTIVDAHDSAFDAMPNPDWAAHAPPGLPGQYMQPGVLGLLGTSTVEGSAPAWWDAGALADQRPVQAAIFMAAYCGHHDWEAEQMLEPDSLAEVVQNGMLQIQNTVDEHGEGAARIVTWVRVPLLDVVSEDTVEAAHALGALDTQFFDADAGCHHKLLWAGQHHAMDPRAEWLGLVLQRSSY